MILKAYLKFNYFTNSVKFQVKSRVSAASLEPVWNEECLIELEGSENLRLLVYQEGGAEGVAHRGRACLELSRSWLTAQYTTQKISLGRVFA